jgi:antitoxin (DNA-binding transcriptional repressor) of toxin-antitoxin stability system
VTDREIDVPADLAFLGRLMDLAEAGRVTYLTHHGRRIAVVVPADVVEAVRRALAAEDDPAPSASRSLNQLRREQGEQPVEDPAELRGKLMADDEPETSVEAATSGRSGDTTLIRTNIGELSRLARSLGLKPREP